MTQHMERAEAGLERVRRCRWADVGRSAHPDGATAGREAAQDALAAGDRADLLIVFASKAYDLRALAEEVSAVAAGIPVVGCASAAEIDGSAPATGSVVVLALGGSGLSFSTTAVSVEGDPRDAGARAAACIGDVADREHRVLLLLTDGPPERQPQIVRGAYSVTGAGVPLVGGVGSADDEQRRPSLLYGGTAVDDAVIGIAIGSDAPLGIGVRHGWQPSGDPMLVTSAEPGRVLELDDRPAAEVYRERLGGRQPKEVVLAHPLGMRRRVGEAHVRTVVDDGAVDGSIAAAIPAGAMVWLMDADDERVLDAAGAACREALDGLDGAPAQALLVFDCIARLGVLGDRAAEEIERIAHEAGDAAIAGLYTYGEVARTRGSTGFHHQTLVVLAIA
jgi:hypothetical protein